MFSVRQKHEIAKKVQILRDTNHAELPEGEIQYKLCVAGAQSWSWADIANNGAVANLSVDPWNEKQDAKQKPEYNREELKKELAIAAKEIEGEIDSLDSSAEAARGNDA